MSDALSHRHHPWRGPPGRALSVRLNIRANPHVPEGNAANLLILLGPRRLAPV